MIVFILRMFWLQQDGIRFPWATHFGTFILYWKLVIDKRHIFLSASDRFQNVKLYVLWLLFQVFQELYSISFFDSECYDFDVFYFLKVLYFSSMFPIPVTRMLICKKRLTSIIQHTGTGQWLSCTYCLFNLNLSMLVVDQSL